MKYDNQLRYATAIISQYNGEIPLSAWLKDFFRANKQMGSRDRKTVSEMVYGFYRLGHNHFKSVEEGVLAFINVSDNLPELKEYFFSRDKHPEISTGRIFPFKKYLSPGIEEEKFSASFLVQPDLFIRVRPGSMDTIIKKLQLNNISFTVWDENCIGFSNSTKLDSILGLNKEAVIQDRSSQQTGIFIKQAAEKISKNPSVWDCCAASGGKSIMAYDIIDNPKLTVSDIRESVIHNLHKRFSEAGIEHFRSFVADLSDNNTKIPVASYDLVIADVPCSGSGTWARTPEQLYFFEEDKIKHYSNLQKEIVTRVIPSMKPQSYLLYITCSVFSDENERVVEYICEKNDLKLVRSELIRGYDKKADTLFAALLTNQLA